MKHPVITAITAALDVLTQTWKLHSPPSLSNSDPPHIQDSPLDLTVNQSSQAIFNCTAHGNPVPTISWTGPGNFTAENTARTNFTVLSVLTINSAVRALHEGLYTCSANNGIRPSSRSSATLTIQGIAQEVLYFHQMRHIKHHSGAVLVRMVMAVHTLLYGNGKVVLLL